MRKRKRVNQEGGASFESIIIQVMGRATEEIGTMKDVVYLAGAKEKSEQKTSRFKAEMITNLVLKRDTINNNLLLWCEQMCARMEISLLRVTNPF